MIHDPSDTYKVYEALASRKEDINVESVKREIIKMSTSSGGTSDLKDQVDELTNTIVELTDIVLNLKKELDSLKESQVPVGLSDFEDIKHVHEMMMNPSILPSVVVPRTHDSTTSITSWDPASAYDLTDSTSTLVERKDQRKSLIDLAREILP